MAYYVCNNEKCKNFGLHQDITREVFKYVSGKGLVGEHAACPECGEDREYVNPKADVPLDEKNVGFGMYSSASAEQKREMLKKRSHEHFNNKVKERKDYLMNKAMSEMKSLGKK